MTDLAALATPLTTCVPKNSEFVRWFNGALGVNVVTNFSAGKLSPVSGASSTNRSLDSSRRQSPGIRSPARSRTTSPGTIAAAPLPITNTVYDVFGELRVITEGAAIRIAWNGTGFILQESDHPDGPYNNLPGIASPYLISPPIGNRYFRLSRP